MARYLEICKAYREIKLFDIPSAGRVIVSFKKKETDVMNFIFIVPCIVTLY